MYILVHKQKCSTTVLKPNSLMYNFVEVSSHNLESSHTVLDVSPYYVSITTLQNLSNLFCSVGGGGGVKSISRGDCE
jgi:hypothetical protein